LNTDFYVAQISEGVFQPLLQTYVKTVEIELKHYEKLLADAKAAGSDEESLRVRLAFDFSQSSSWNRMLTRPFEISWST
jgi:hypothetical protein